MTNNQQMLDVLDKLMKKGWKFEEVLKISLHSRYDNYEMRDKNSKVIYGEFFEINDKHYKYPTILEAEAVIIKMLDVTKLSIIIYSNGCGFYEVTGNYTTVAFSEQWTKAMTKFDKPDKRRLAVLQLAYKLAEAEPDKFKLIFEEK